MMTLPWQLFQIATLVSSRTFKREWSGGTHEHAHTQGCIIGYSLLSKVLVPVSPCDMNFSHLLDCSCRCWWATRPSVTWEVTDGLTDIVPCKVVGFALGMTGPPAWDPHTFSTWGGESCRVELWQGRWSCFWLSTTSAYNLYYVTSTPFLNGLAYFCFVFSSSLFLLVLFQVFSSIVIDDTPLP